MRFFILKREKTKSKAKSKSKKKVKSKSKVRVKKQDQKSRSKTGVGSMLLAGLYQQVSIIIFFLFFWGAQQEHLRAQDQAINQAASEQLSMEATPEAVREFIRNNKERLRPFLSETIKSLALEAYPKGTLVKTGENSYLPIEELREGSTVVSFDYKNKKFVTGTVGACRKAFTKKFLEFSYDENKTKRDHATPLRIPCNGKFYHSSIDRWVPFMPTKKIPFHDIQKRLSDASQLPICCYKEVEYEEPQEG